MNTQPKSSATTQAPVTGFQSLFGKAAEFTVVGAFLLYALGFIVWHSFLARFGISSVGFVQVEYFSAALCYLVITVSLGLPPALLLERLYDWLSPDALAARIESGETSENVIPRGTGKKESLSFVIFLWYAASTQLIRVFFPSSYLNFSTPSVIVLAVVGIGSAIYLYFLTTKWVQMWKQRTKEATAAFLKLQKYPVLEVAFITFGLVTLFSTDGLNKPFLVSTTVLYGLLFYGYGYGLSIREFPTATRPAKVMMLILFSLILSTHISAFGIKQFGEIPRHVGGGKPQTAYLKFNTNNLDLVGALNLPMITNLPTLKGFVGPVSILTKSDKEILLVNEAELSLPEYYTNQITSIKNSTSTNFLTNYSIMVITNKDGTLSTNKGFNVVATPSPTNILGSNNVTLKNPTKLTAKQVRADLIDAIIFAR